MKTWIFYIEAEKAKVFYLDDKENMPKLHSTISRMEKLRGSRGEVYRLRPNFLRYVAEEINIACGAGTQASLVLCAASNLTLDVIRYLSPGVTMKMHAQQRKPNQSLSSLLKDAMSAFQVSPAWAV